MITIEGTDVSVSESAVRDWVDDNVVSAFRHVGVSRRITIATGEVITLSGGTYGNRVDAAGEATRLTADLMAKEAVEREPVYAYQEWGTENGGVGYTFIEVDLDAQTVYLMDNGRCVYTTPIVSGDPASGNATATGVFYVASRTTNPEEKHYNIPVEYWMSLGDNAGIVLHDAGWRDVFGGTIYRGDGSKGNIELTRDAAAYLYDRTSVGIPVVIH